MQEFKIRCSAIGRIMPEPKNKADKEAGKLSETAKTYVSEWLTEQIYGVKKDLTDRKIKKGNICEDESIALYGLSQDVGFVIKNISRYEDEYMKGTPDIVLAKKVVDTKTSWDCFTFPLFDTKLDNKDYWWQLQGYMHLTGKKQAEVAYCLVNTPEELCYTDLDRMDYSNFDVKHRVKIFTVDYDPEAIEQVRRRVEQIREYIRTEIDQNLLK